MRRIGSTLILLGIAGFVLPLFGVQFRLVTAIQESLGELGRYATLLLAAAGVFILLSVELFGQFAARSNTEILREVQSDLLVKAIPTQEEIGNVAVSKLSEDTIVALYPHIERIVIARAAGVLYSEIDAQFSAKAGVSELEVEYFLWALDLIDQSRKKALSSHLRNPQDKGNAKEC